MITMKMGMVMMMIEVLLKAMMIITINMDAVKIMLIMIIMMKYGQRMRIDPNASGITYARLFAAVPNTSFLL